MGRLGGRRVLQSESSDNIENNDNDWTGHTLNYHNEEEYEGKVTGRRMMMRRREGKVLSL